jgi:hypothetical protein
MTEKKTTYTSDGVPAEESDDTHDQLVKQMIKYAFWNTRFRDFGYFESSIRARNALLEIAKLCKIRRIEIFDEREKLSAEYKIQKASKRKSKKLHS